MKRYENYSNNLKTFAKASEQDLTNEFIISGIIDKFFIQFELGWKLMKDLLKYEGRREGETGSPRTIIKAAYQVYAFLDEDLWLAMLRDRNDMTHIYDGNAAKELVGKIINEFIPEFQRLQDEIKQHYGDELNTL